MMFWIRFSVGKKKYVVENSMVAKAFKMEKKKKPEVKYGKENGTKDESCVLIATYPETITNQFPQRTKKDSRAGDRQTRHPFRNISIFMSTHKCRSLNPVMFGVIRG